MNAPYSAQLDIRRKIFLSFLAPLIGIGIVVALLLWQVNQLIQSAKWLDHTNQVISGMQELQKEVIDTETGFRGFLITGKDQFLQPYTAALPRIQDGLTTLSVLVRDNPSQQHRVDEIGNSFGAWDETAKSIMNERRANTAHYMNRISNGETKNVMDGIRAQIAAFLATEEQFRAVRSRSNQNQAANTLLMALLSSLIVGGFVTLFSKRSLNQITASYAEALANEREQAVALREAQTGLELKVEERTRDLTAANKELEAFSYSVSHDLRSPLRSMEGFSKILIERYGSNLEPTAKDYLSRIRASTVRMGRLIDDLLSLSRISRTEVRRESVDLSQIVEKIATELHESAPERKASFVIPPHLTAHVDRNLIEIVLRNLVGNAWKYSSKREDSLIEFGSESSTGHSSFFVRDNGAGFDMAYKNKLFGAFNRLHTATDFEGIGIGLATVQRIIERHDGTVWGEGEVDGGATFHFQLN